MVRLQIPPASHWCPGNRGSVKHPCPLRCSTATRPVYSAVYPTPPPPSQNNPNVGRVPVALLLFSTVTHCVEVKVLEISQMNGSLIQAGYSRLVDWRNLLIRFANAVRALRYCGPDTSCIVLHHPSSRSVYGWKWGREAKNVPTTSACCHKMKRRSIADAHGSYSLTISPPTVTINHHGWLRQEIFLNRKACKRRFIFIR